MTYYLCLTNVTFSNSVKSSFTTSLNELVSKKLEIACKIMHMILKYQKLGGVTVISDSQVKVVHRKIIYYGLQEKQPNFLGKRSMSRIDNQNSLTNSFANFAALIAVLMSDSNPKDVATYIHAKLKNTANYVNFLKLGEACNTIYSDLNIDISPGR